MDTVGEFVRGVGGREIRPPACPILPKTPDDRPSTGIRQQYQSGSGEALLLPRPGSRGALLLPSPLRTARKPFGLCRSSLSQGPSRDPVGHRRSTCTILVWGRRAEHAGDRTSSEAAVICSASRASCSDGLVRRHPREVSPLSRGVISPRAQPLSDPITGRPSLPPSSSTRRPIGSPCGGPTPQGGRRAYHVPRMNHRWFRPCLSAGGLDSDGRGRGIPCTWPRTFWSKPLSTFGLLVLTTFIGSSPGLAMPSTLAPDRLGAGSRRAPSREARPPCRGEDTLSQELRTAGLPRPHVLVGYRWSHTGLCPE